MTTLDTTTHDDSTAPREGAGPGLLDRTAARLFLRLLDEVAGGSVVLTLPDGTVQRSGTPGAGPDVRITAHAWRAFRRALGGDLAAAESFLDGDWSTDDLVGVVELFVANAERFDRDTPLSRLVNVWHRLLHAARRNTRRGSRRNVKAHYDLGNDFYRLFLDEGMTYSCALFDSPSATLEEAQEAKLERIASLARLAPGQRVLEIGCGWGGFAVHAAKAHGCRVVGLTLSDEQAALARGRVAREGLSDLVEIRLQDYRDVPERGFDRIVSIEMLEAVGHDYLPEFFRRCDALLGPHGLAVIQSITIPDHRHDRLAVRPDFIKKHVFPGSHIPSVTCISTALARHTRLFIDRLEEIGPHYAETLRRWRVRFLAERARVEALGFDRRFQRMWEYYLAYCEGGFRTRFVNDVQLVLTRSGNRSLGPAPAYPGTPGG